MNRSPNQTLCLNIFGIELSERKIFRHIIQVKLIDEQNKKEYILTTMSSRGRGDRSSKQQDNFILLNLLLDWHQRDNSDGKTQKDPPAFAYDGAQSLFTLEPIVVELNINKDDALEIPGISVFLKDSLTRLNGSLTISCEPDSDKPSFRQVDYNEWDDPRFYAYLDIVTSQGAIRSGKYLSQSKGLYVNTKYLEPLRCKWAVAANGVHKGCRIVGVQDRPLPVLELDPQSTQYYASIPLHEILLYAFGKEFSSDPRRPPVQPSGRLIRAMKLVFKDLKCNPYYDDQKKFGTNTLTVSDIDFTASSNHEYQEQFPNLKFPNFPAAVCAMGPHKRRFPFEYLKALPYQSLDRRVLEEFDLTPRANAPNERWTTLQEHFKQFGFNDETMQAFGVQLCNDPFTNISEITGDRVDKPEISYASRVVVDDEKRDWKAQEVPFVQPSNIDVVVVVLIVGYSRNFEDDKSTTEKVVHQYLNRCREKGMKIGRSEFRHKKGEADAERFLTDTFRDLIKMPNYTDPRFTPFVLLISDDVPNIHECLKFEERMSDIPTQHVLLKNIRKINENIMKKIQAKRRVFDLTLDNIVMKVNIKTGGLNYTADVPKDIACWKDRATFVVGLDVAHPDRLSKREGHPSTVGLSCNSAENPYSFVGDFAYTAPTKEAIDDGILRKFIDTNVRSFAQIRGFPKKIIIFRDGVSFGEECEAAREAQIIERTIIAAAREQGLRDYSPKMLVVVVKKRHHTRFYARGGYDGAQPVNPLPDTAIGGDIAEYGKRQIFIQAFRPVQGTAKVPSFIIIRDDEDVSDDHISKVVCAVCSLHQLVNSPTSIPTPVYVAHELAKRGTGLFKAYRFKNGDSGDDWESLTSQLSYSTLDRLSKVRVV